jgi:hypothetical protein
LTPLARRGSTKLAVVKIGRVCIRSDRGDETLQSGILQAAETHAIQKGSVRQSQRTPQGSVNMATVLHKELSRMVVVARDRRVLPPGGREAKGRATADRTGPAPAPYQGVVLPHAWNEVEPAPEANATLNSNKIWIAFRLSLAFPSLCFLRIEKGD